MLAGWFPDFHTNSGGDRGDALLASALARLSVGDMTAAAPLVAALERDSASPRGRVRATIARTAALVARFRLLDGGHLFEGPSRDA
ncbi:MAG TPA: hypothetical protein VFY65_12865, partial [Longimicrobium sp.]|nr:hypothetical protein [Longimicrobium sp.]